MAGFRNWRLHLKARSAAAKGLRADEISRLARKAHNVAAGSSSEEPAASEPGPGVGGRDRDRGI